MVITTATGISASNMDIGRANGGYFDGKIDDVRVYNRVLSTTEITRLAQLGMTTKIGTTIYSNPELESGLLGHWTLDGKDTVDEVATDRSGSNDGDISGYSFTEDATTTLSYTLDISVDVPNIQDIAFSRNGRKMYLIDNVAATINEYTLSTPFLLSSASFTAGTSVSAQLTAPAGVTFNANGSKLFIVGSGGSVSVNEYSLSVAYDSTSLSFVTSYDISGEETGPKSVRFNQEGTKMFVMGTQGDDVNEYTLSQGFDLSSTVTHVDSFSVNGETTTPAGLAFNDEGTRMFVSGNQGTNVEEYTLGTGFDVSTAVHTDAFNIESIEVNRRGIAFSNNGMKMFVSGVGGDNVYEFVLTHSFDLGGIATTTNVTAVPGRLGSALDFDGIDDYIDISGVEAGADETQGTLAAWVYIPSSELDGAADSFVEIGDASSGDSVVGLRLNASGFISFLYRVGGVSTYSAIAATSYVDTWIHVLSTWETGGVQRLYINGVQVDSDTRGSDIADGLFDQASIGADAQSAVSGYFEGKVDDVRIYDRALSAAQAMRLAQLGMTTKIGVTPPENPDIQGSLAGHWTFDGKDIDGSSVLDSSNSNNGTVNGQTKTITVSFVDSQSVLTNSANPHDVTFNRSGTKMFVVDGSEAIDEYALGTAFDVSTASYTDTKSLTGTGPTGVTFKTDGTKMFISDDNGDFISQYSLSIPFDVSTASYDLGFGVGPQETHPRDVALSTNGFKMFVLGSTGDDVNEYSLSTAFDVSSASYVDSFSVASEETTPEGIVFNTNGTKMFITGGNSNNVNEYSLSTAFDVSSASFADSFSVNSQEDLATGMAFSTLGTKMFIVGTTGDDVNEYTLNEGFDIAGTFTQVDLTPGRLGSALQFDGVDDYVDISGVSSGIDESQGSFSAWVYIPEASLDASNQGIVEVGDVSSSNDVLGLRITSSNNIAFLYRVGGVTTYSQVSGSSYLDQWIHLVGTWKNDNQQYFYINGSQVDNDARASDIPGSSLDQAFIGVDAQAALNQYFKGKIDDVRIYSRDLSSSEISRLYQTGI